MLPSDPDDPFDDPPSTPSRRPAPPPSSDEYLNWGSLLTMGMVTAVAIAIGVLLGLLVDHLIGTGPVFLFIGLVIGIAAAVAYIVVKIRTYLPSH